jgi:hypothetical protein
MRLRSGCRAFHTAVAVPSDAIARPGYSTVPDRVMTVRVDGRPGAATKALRAILPVARSRGPQRTATWPPGAAAAASVLVLPPGSLTGAPKLPPGERIAARAG